MATLVGRLLVTASFPVTEMNSWLLIQTSLINLKRATLFSPPKNIYKKHLDQHRCHSWASKSIAEALASLSLYEHPFLYNGHIFLPMRKFGPIFKVGTRVDSFPVYIIIRFETCCFSPSSILFWMPPPLPHLSNRVPALIGTLRYCFGRGCSAASYTVNSSCGYLAFVLKQPSSLYIQHMASLFCTHLQRKY
jgi:hypothetical protein